MKESRLEMLGDCLEMWHDGIGFLKSYDGKEVEGVWMNRLLLVYKCL